MSKATEELKPKLDRLTAKERQEVVNYLLKKSKPGQSGQAVDKELAKVLERRLDEIRTGKVKGVSEEDFIADLREEFP